MPSRRRCSVPEGKERTARAGARREISVEGDAVSLRKKMTREQDTSNSGKRKNFSPPGEGLPAREGGSRLNESPEFLRRWSLPS